MKRGIEMNGETTPKRRHYLNNRNRFGMSSSGYNNYYHGIGPEGPPGSSMPWGRWHLDWYPPLPPEPSSLLFNMTQPPPPPFNPPLPPPPPPEDPPPPPPADPPACRTAPPPIVRSSPPTRPDTSPAQDITPPPANTSPSQNSTPSKGRKEGSASPGEVRGKRKRKTASRHVGKEWNREDAERVLAVENEYSPSDASRTLVIKFPDPKITRDMVQGFSSAIELVHFQQPVTPRHCFVKLRKGVDVQATIAQLSRVRFGGGKITVELKQEEFKHVCPPEGVDPFSLYVGNLPQSVTTGAVKEIFPTAVHVDVGFSPRMKHTRYAFVNYSSVDAAIEAFRKTRNTVFENRSLILRFYRYRSSIRAPGQGDAFPAKNSSAPTTSTPREKTPEPEPEIVEDLEIVPEDSDTSHESAPPEPEDSKATVLEEASRLSQSITNGGSEAPTIPVRIKTEVPDEVTIEEDASNALRIKTELLDEDLDDKLYNKLISAQKEEEEPSDGEDYDEESEELMSEEESNDEDALKYGLNHWDILRKEEERRKQQQIAVSEVVATRSPLPLRDGQLDRLASLFGCDFGEFDEQNDPEFDDLFNQLNPDDLDEEFVFSSY
ncbi:uncharacterized protein LOC132256665 [Phlebotomus argentipes]|uniref:uncharacterized protein LOC132256665 n=1 Tax=Phlebotomus argentipes TaxID=94469 RepID=UPI0028931C8D|nr:uncharacterized protein LOC132256665 [Phlebotomus argentipes]